MSCNISHHTECHITSHHLTSPHTTLCRQYVTFPVTLTAWTDNNQVWYPYQGRDNTAENVTENVDIPDVKFNDISSADWR